MHSMQQAALTLSASAANLRRLAMIRLILMAGLLTALAYAYYTIHTDIILPAQ